MQSQIKALFRNRDTNMILPTRLMQVNALIACFVIVSSFPVRVVLGVISKAQVIASVIQSVEVYMIHKFRGQQVAPKYARQDNPVHSLSKALMVSSAITVGVISILSGIGVPVHLREVGVGLIHNCGLTTSQGDNDTILSSHRVSSYWLILTPLARCEEFLLRYGNYSTGVFR